MKEAEDGTVVLGLVLAAEAEPVESTFSSDFHLALLSVKAAAKMVDFRYIS